MNQAWLSPVTLTDQHVKLSPLTSAHRNELLTAAADGQLWDIWYTSVPSEQSIDKYMEDALEEAALGNGLPFVVTDLERDLIVGSTRFCNGKAAFRRVEIGYTWYAKSYQRTGINTRCKYLLLQYAFEHLRAIAVEFNTNWHNQPSRNAILRLGAKQDGVLRNHRIDSEGIIRDTVVFSIIEQEWPSVKKNLAYKIQI